MTVAAPKDAERELVEELLETTGSPADRFAVAALLETRGLRDRDAVERFGKRDLFELADEIYEQARAELAACPPPPEEERETSWARTLRRFARLYGRGTFFGLPMVVQIMSVLLLRLGTFGHFTDRQATAVSLGTILSFAVTGGFQQTIGRLGFSYRGQENYVLAQRVCYRVIADGLVVTAALGALWLAANVVSSAFPLSTALASLVYFLLLSPLWLFLAVLYMLEKRISIFVIVCVWIGVVAVLTGYTGLAVYHAHWIGLGVSALLALGWGRRLLSREAARTSPDLVRTKLPPRAALMYWTTAPYFAYGVLYFGYLFIDRVVGWSQTTPSGYALWFRRPYELGLDWALLSLVLTIALLEYTIHEFSEVVIPQQKRSRGDAYRRHNAAFERFYARQLGLFAAVAVVSVTVIFWTVWLLARIDALVRLREFTSSSITLFVFAWAALGYALLVWGMMNAVFFFSLSRPAFVLRSLAPAALVAVAVGAVLSRTHGYWYSTVGLAAGAGVYALLTTWYAIHVLRDLDYYYYSAY